MLNTGIGAGLLLGVYGFNTSSGIVTYQTMVQREVPAKVRGRAFALLDIVWQSGRLASIAVGAGLAASIGIRALFVLGGALLILSGFLGLISLSSVHRRR